MTKDEVTVPCDDKFMPTHLFMRAKDDDIEEEYTEHTNKQRSPTRIITIYKDGKCIELLCLLLSQTTSKTLHMRDSLYDMFQVHNESPQKSEYRLMYVHATKGRCKAIECRQERAREHKSSQNMIPDLFSIAAIPSYGMPKQMDFRIAVNEMSAARPASILGGSKKAVR